MPTNRNIYFGHSDARATDEYIRSITPGATITTGAIRKLSDAAAEAHEAIAKTKSTLADLERRIAYLERNKDEHARWGRRA
jgi:hypothetical protein